MPTTQPLTTQQALQKAMALCARQERCKKELMDKFKTWGLDLPSANEIILQLETLNFIDESRFVQAFIKGKYNTRKWGKQKIIYHLKQKQIPDAIIQEFLPLINDESYNETMLYQLQKKLRQTNESNPLKLKNKLLRFGLSKGYEYAQVYKIIQEITK